MKIFIAFYCLKIKAINRRIIYYIFTRKTITMNKEQINDINIYPFISGVNNNQMKSSFNKREIQNLFNEDYKTSEEENLIEDNNEKEMEYLDENSKDFINKKIIDLSFLDSVTNDPGDNNINKENIIKDDAPRLNNIFNKGKDENEKNYDSEYNYKNIEKNRYLYKMMILNNIYQNYNYFQQMAYINNLMHNYQQMNNQNTMNQTFSKTNWNNKKKAKKSIDKRYLINLMDIKTDKEKRTTIRMMNIPSYFRPSDLSKKLDEKFGISPQKENRVYDFIYIPFKESGKTEGLTNAGYAFINFVHPKHILKFYSFFHGKHLKLKTSGKVCIITFATRQGTDMKYKGFEQSANDKYMYFSDTKNHFQLLTD